MNVRIKSPKQWYQEAVQRPVNVPEKTLESRLRVAEGLRQISTDSGHPPTKEMIADEMLLITGKMDKDEFNRYLNFKTENGGWVGGSNV